METNNIILIVIILSVAFNAIGDGLRIRDYANPTKLKGILYHVFSLLSILVMVSLVLVLDKRIYVLDFVLILTGYACIRFGIFDFILNIVAGKHFLYLGDTAGIDKLLKRIFNTPTKLGILASLRSIIFIVGLAIIQHLI